MIIGIASPKHHLMSYDSRSVSLFESVSFSFQFFLCEVLNFLVDVVNLYFTDVFLGGRFLRYGTQVIKYYAHSHAERRDLPNPMCTVFPTVTR